MTEHVIEHYETFNTKGCPDKLIFDNLMTKPFHPTIMISSMMTMTI